MSNKREIYFAGGCFWGTEHYLKQIRGVEHTEVGYANGNIENPTYEQVCTDKTGFAETVHVIYDSDIISLPRLIDLYLKIIDPTSLNKQGGDQGTQYRTGVFYTNNNDLPLIKNSLEKIAENYDKPLVVEIKPLNNFYKAEDYHQEYLIKNPTGYCHIHPELFEFARKAN